MRYPRSVVLGALTALACGTGASGGSARGGCGTPGDSVISAAVNQYVVGLTPRPQRFLLAVGDSSLPDAARSALQAKGPTYLYPPDSALRRQVHDKLTGVGDYPTLLLSYGGLQQMEENRAVVRLGGRFVSGSLDNHPAPARAVHFQCDSAGWRFTHAVGDQSS